MSLFRLQVKHKSLKFQAYNYERKETAKNETKKFHFFMNERVAETINNGTKQSRVSIYEVLSLFIGLLGSVQLLKLISYYIFLSKHEDGKKIHTIFLRCEPI